MRPELLLSIRWATRTTLAGRDAIWDSSTAIPTVIVSSDAPKWR
jgi:hypothetical protein